MRTLKFPIAGVRKLIDHATSATEWSKPFYDEDGTPEPCLLFVKDDGIYLMSNGIPQIPVADDHSHVVYAKGYDPHKNGDVWDKCRDAVGGDDFVEYLELQPNLTPIPEGAVAFVIKVSATRMECGWDVKTTRASMTA